MPIPYYHVDSFTDELFAGNPAGVCVLAAFPTDTVMQKIAAENRHSETAFMVAREDGDFDLRWFTPVVEDNLCGHATLAAAYVLELRGHTTWPVRFHTVSGLMLVHREGERFALDFPIIPATACEPPSGLFAALGLKKAEVLRDPRDFLVVVDHEEMVRNLKPDIAALAGVNAGIGGVIVAAPAESDVDYVYRFFAPNAGIDEDPATGSVHCPMVPYWAKRMGKHTFTARQLSLRGARMWCTLAGDRVRIAGNVKLYLQGNIEL